MWHCRHRRTWLLRCLKSLVLEEHPSAVNMLKGPEYCRNLHNSTFISHFITTREIRTSLLLISEIVRLFVDTLTAEDTYSVCNRGALLQPIPVQLSNKKKFCRFSLNFKSLHHILKILKNKNVCIRRMYFRNYRLWKTLLLKCLIYPLSNTLQTVNLLKIPKHL